MNDIIEIEDSLTPENVRAIWDAKAIKLENSSLTAQLWEDYFQFGPHTKTRANKLFEPCQKLSLLMKYSEVFRLFSIGALPHMNSEEDFIHFLVDLGIVLDIETATLANWVYITNIMSRAFQIMETVDWVQKDLDGFCRELEQFFDRQLLPRTKKSTASCNFTDLIESIKENDTQTIIPDKNNFRSRERKHQPAELQFSPRNQITKEKVNGVLISADKPMSLSQDITTLACQEIAIPLVSKDKAKGAPTEYLLQYVNEIDNEKPLFKAFTRDLIFTNDSFAAYKILHGSQVTSITCNCGDNGCSNEYNCACAQFNRSKNFLTTSYLTRKSNGEKYLNPKGFNSYTKTTCHMFECAPECNCNKAKCFNALINDVPATGDPNWMKYQKALIVTRMVKQCSKIKKVMWGLKTKMFIPKHSCLLEYTGVMLTRPESDQRTMDYKKFGINFLFDVVQNIDLGKQKQNSPDNIDIVSENTSCTLRGYNGSQLIDSSPPNNEGSKDVSIWVDDYLMVKPQHVIPLISELQPMSIDAYEYGSLSRFVNHSCNPNMCTVPIHADRFNDILLPRIFFFAKRDILPGEELTIDYHVAPLSNKKGDGCLCGEACCRYGFPNK